MIKTPCRRRAAAPADRAQSTLRTLRFRRLALEGVWWTAAYEVGVFLYLFNPKTAAWDRLDLRTIADDKQEPRAPKGR